MVVIKGKEYKLKFKIGFWKKIKEEAEVTQINLEQKLSQDFGKVAPLVIYYGIYYGLPNRPSSMDDLKFTLDDIENELDYSAMDEIEAAVIDGMTIAQKELLKIAEEVKKNELEDLVEKSKKKLL